VARSGSRIQRSPAGPPGSPAQPAAEERGAGPGPEQQGHGTTAHQAGQGSLQAGLTPSVPAGNPPQAACIKHGGASPALAASRCRRWSASLAPKLALKAQQQQVTGQPARWCSRARASAVAANPRRFSGPRRPPRASARPRLLLAAIAQAWSTRRTPGQADRAHASSAAPAQGPPEQAFAEDAGMGPSRRVQAGAGAGPGRSGRR